jgi:hypothetical protein
MIFFVAASSMHCSGNIISFAALLLGIAVSVKLGAAYFSFSNCIYLGTRRQGISV